MSKGCAALTSEKKSDPNTFFVDVIAQLISRLLLIQPGISAFSGSDPKDSAPTETGKSLAIVVCSQLRDRVVAYHISLPMTRRVLLN